MNKRIIKYILVLQKKHSLLFILIPVIVVAQPECSVNLLRFGAARPFERTARGDRFKAADPGRLRACRLQQDEAGQSRSVRRGLRQGRTNVNTEE